MRKFFQILIAAFLAVVIFSASVLDAQDDVIQYGQSISGAVTADKHTFRYSFTGAAGDTIYASMFASGYNFPTSLRLYGPNGTRLGEVVDNAMGALLGPITLASEGLYELEAARVDWDSESTGDFSLLLDRAESREIRASTPLDGHLSQAGAAAFFTYNGEANALLGFYTSGSALGLTIISPGGEVVGGQATTDINLFSVLNLLPEAGEYTILLQTQDAAGSDYSLRFEPVNPVSIDTGKPVRGTMNAATPAVLMFTSAADKLLAIKSNISNAQGIGGMTIIGENDLCCSIITDTDDSGPGLSFDPFLTPNGGVYYIVLWVNEYAPQDATFDYEVSLDASKVATLIVGTPANGKITSASGLVTFIYAGVVDELIHVSVEQTGGQGALGLRILSPDDEVLTFTGRSSRNASFDVVLPTSGLYQFEVSNVNYDDSDVEFSLLLDAAS